MTTAFFHCYDTALGTCAIAWNECGLVTGSQLPEASAIETRDRMRVRHRAAREVTDMAALPPAIAAAVAGVRALLAGEPRDLRDIELDETGVPEFNRRVHALTRAIPVGQTRTYGELAMALGQPGAARAVGQAEGHNPFAPIVPCHRVLAAAAGQGGFSAHGGLATKQKLLAIEARAVGRPRPEQSPLF